MAAEKAVHVNSCDVFCSRRDFRLVSGRRTQVLVSPALETAKRMAIGLTIIEAGERSPRHTHAAVEEGVYVVAGRGTFKVGDEVIQAEPGSVLFLPSDIPHHVENEASEPLELLWWYAPSGPETRILAAEAGA